MTTNKERVFNEAAMKIERGVRCVVNIGATVALPCGLTASRMPSLVNGVLLVPPYLLRSPLVRTTHARAPHTGTTRLPTQHASALATGAGIWCPDFCVFCQGATVLLYILYIYKEA